MAGCLCSDKIRLRRLIGMRSVRMRRDCIILASWHCKGATASRVSLSHLLIKLSAAESFPNFYRTRSESRYRTAVSVNASALELSSLSHCTVLPRQLLCQSSTIASKPPAHRKRCLGSLFRSGSSAHRSAIKSTRKIQLSSQAQSGSDKPVKHPTKSAAL